MGLGVAFIVVIEFCERICYYTFQGTQKSWLQDRGYSSAQSSSLNQVFGLLSYITGFFGGWLADTSVGRYRTIAALVVLYVIGCFMAAVAANPSAENVPLYMIGTMGLVALGTGGIKPNVCTFGADQIDPDEINADRKRASFFLYFYLTVNVGCLIAFGLLANIATNGLPPLVPQEDGYFLAYMIASACMAIALLLYLGGTPFYRKESFATSSKSMLRLCVQRLLSGSSQFRGKVALLGWSLIPLLIVVAVVQAFGDSATLTMASLVLDILCMACLCWAHRDNTWLGADEVTRCLDCVPILLIGNVAFNVLYNCMSSIFYAEACQMDTRLGSGSEALQLNGAFLNLADSVAIIIFTPLIDRLFVPCVEKMLRRKVSLNMKVFAGISVGIGSQLVAAFLEYLRKDAEVLNIPSYCAPLGADGEHVSMSSISVFWMAIPYGMIGMGEVLINPVLQHCAYEGAPISMRSMLQAFNLFAMGGMPNAISAGISMATQTYTPNDLNNGNLVVVYLINAAIGAVGCAIFYWASCGSGARNLSRALETCKSDAVAVKGDGEKQAEVSSEATDAASSDEIDTEHTL